MHTAAKQPSETANTNTQTAEEVLAQLKTIYRVKRIESEVTIVAAQTKALETLMACMTPIKSTGDTKLDNFYARERNRQRLAAIQTLLHIRTVQREKRLRRAMREKAKAKAERTAKGGVVRSEADGHVDNGSTPPSPLAGEGGRATGRMRGRSVTSDQPNNTTSGCAADPSPQHSPARGEGANPPSPQRGRRWSCAASAQDRMKGRPESSTDRSSNGATGGSPASAGPHQPEPRADNATPTILTEPTTPTAPHWRASRQWHPKQPKPLPAPSRTSPAAGLIAVAGSTAGLKSTARGHRPPTPLAA